MKSLSKEIILKNSKAYKFDNNIIYFLMKENEIVYVGQSKNGMKRIHAHLYDVEFDSYHYINCTLDQLNDLEAHYIIKFNPLCNNSLPPNNMVKSLKQLKLIYNIGTIFIKKLCKKYKIPSLYNNDYYSIEVFEQALLKEKVI